MPPKQTKTAPSKPSKSPTAGSKKPNPKSNPPPPPTREEKNEFVESDLEDGGDGASPESSPRSAARTSSAKNGGERNNAGIQHSEDFEEEYRTVQEQSANGLALMTDTTLAINEQIIKVEGIPSEELFMDAEQLDELQNGVVQTKKLLLASHRYLKADYTTALGELRDAIDRYAKALLAKLKDDRKYVIYKGKLTEHELRLMQQRNAGHNRIAEIARQLLELEKIVEDIALTAEGIEAALMDVVDEAEKLKDLLKEGKREGEEKSQEEEEEQPEQNGGEEEKEEEEEPPKEEEKPVEDEEAKRAQEEKERLEKEERERLERLRREEEERRRRELEEEERKRREEAERKRREGPKHFPPLIYNLDDIEESFINGENRDIACVVRSPPELGLQKEQLEATLLNMLANRYPPMEGEELFSNLIRLRPTNGQDMEFSEPVYIALPNNGGVKGGREFCIKIQEVVPPTPPPPEETEEEEVAQTNEATSAEETEQDKQTDNQEETGQDAEQTENKEGTQEEGQTTGQEGGQAENQETEQGQDAAQEEADKAKNEQEKKEEEEAAKEVERRREAERRESRVVKEQPKPVVEEVKPVKWEEVETQETSIEGLDGRFVETKVTKIPATGLNILVITRPKHEKEKFNSKGGKLIWPADPRIFALIPKNAFRLETELGMQVVPVDSASLAGFKERYDGCDDLLGTSPLVRLTVPVKPSKALIVAVTNPTGGTKNRRPEGGASGGPGGRPSLPNLKPKPATPGNGNGELDVVSLMMKDPKGRWKHADDVQLHPEKDSTTFEFSEIHDRLVLLRTKMRMDSAELIKIVTKLETSLAERAVTVVVRQSNSNPAHFWLDCSRKENTEKVLQRMREGQFTEGPDPSAQICLREGDVIKMSFRDNLDFEDGLARQVVFNSSLTSASIHATVNALNTFAQNALDFFRGYIQLSLVERPYQAPPRLAQRPRKDKNQDGGFLCELPLTLPKPTKEIFRKKRIELPIPTEGPLCEEYFNHLANEIKDEWLKMAPKLGHDAASIQRITQYHAYLDTNEALYSCVRQMLVDWFKAAEKSKDKVNDLRLALLEGERVDLAEELVAKDRELKAELERQQREALLEQCIKAYSDSQAARKSWRPVAKALGLSHEDMAAIAGDGSGAMQVITLEQAKEMLTRWQQIRGEQATKESLIVVLKKLKLNEAAANVSLVR